MTYSYAADKDDNYQGKYPTEAEAIAAGFADSRNLSTVWIGQNIEPTPPEEYWLTEEFIELVDMQEDYRNEESWCNSTLSQDLELQATVRQAIAAWLDKYDLRPKHWSVKVLRMVERSTLPACT